jgi:hypothetical protein
VNDFASLHTYTGIAGGHTVGVAPCSNIYGLKVLDGIGNGLTSYALDALKVVKQRHVLNPNAKSVVSMSMGSYCGFDCRSKHLVKEISSMYDLGILFAVAALNKNNDDACHYYPAASPKAITVAASDSGDYFASYSNTGSCVDIIAPGTNIMSACATCKSSPCGTACQGKSTYKSLDGTSQATAFVAGTLALLLQKRQVSFTTAPDIVKKALLCDAEKYRITIPGPSSWTTMNLLLQVPKDDSSFGNCSLNTDWRLRVEGNVLVFRYMDIADTKYQRRIAFYPKKQDYGVRIFHRNEATRELYRSGNWAIREETGVLVIRSSFNPDLRFAFFPGNGKPNYGSGIVKREYGTQVLLSGYRWSIQVEEGVLVFRDMLTPRPTPGGHRFAFYQSKVNM